MLICAAAVRSPNERQNGPAVVDLFPLSTKIWAMKTNQKVSLLLSLLLAASQIQCASFAKKKSAKLAPSERLGEPPQEGLSYAFDQREPAAVKKYSVSSEKLCDGYPALDVELPPGFCAGLLLDGTGIFRKPRMIAEHRGALFVIDMGGWGSNESRLFRLDRVQGSWQSTLILSKTDLGTNQQGWLDRSSGLLKGPDGFIYVGAAAQIWRFDPRRARSAKELLRGATLVVTDFPRDLRRNLHPLKHFIFNRQGELLVNIGALSNNCEGDVGLKSSPPRCSEEGSYGKLLRFKIPKNLVKPLSAKSAPTFAEGLRNSIALAVDPRSGLLYQGENSRDLINKVDAQIDGARFPHDELNRIDEGGHYGWPYCYDDGAVSPEFAGHDCSTYNQPIALLPPHSAPLGMVFYRGKMFPDWYQNKLIIGLHGFALEGHRLAVVEVTREGQVQGEAFEFLGGWKEKEGSPRGAPVGLLVAADGALLIVEDNNRTILRVAYDAVIGVNAAPKKLLSRPLVEIDGEDSKVIEKRRLDLQERLANPQDVFAQFQARVIDNSCVQCHGGKDGAKPQLLLHDDLGNALVLKGANPDGKSYVLSGQPEKSEIFSVIASGRMPPAGFEGDTDQIREQKLQEALSLLRRWISAP